MVFRVLDEHPVGNLSEYVRRGGGDALRAARLVEPTDLVDVIAESGLRGRGGAGFPTATKWRSVLANASEVRPTTVVINAAEGEPSTFKDRTILRNNVFRVFEGALIACHVVAASELIVAIKGFVRGGARHHRIGDHRHARCRVDRCHWCPNRARSRLVPVR